MIVLVTGDLSVSSSDPVRVTGGGEVLSGELTKGIGADGQFAFRSQDEHYLLELVLEVLEGQGVLEDGGVIDTRVTGHGSLVDGVSGGHGHGTHGAGESE